MIKRRLFEVIAKLCRVNELVRLCIVWLINRGRIKQYNKSVAPFEWPIFVVWVCPLQTRIGAAEGFNVLLIWT
jgi:hypothetical protein